MKELGLALRSREAFLDIPFSVTSNNHAVTVFTEGLSLFVRDTALNGFPSIAPLEEIGKLMDAVLYFAK